MLERLYALAALLFIFSLLVAVVVTFYAWPANRELFLSFRRWLIARPMHRRMKDDPVFRRRMETIAAYDAAVVNLLFARADAKRRSSRTADAELEKRKHEAATCLIGLDADGLDAVAEYLHEGPLGQRVPVDDIRTFLEEERRVVATAPYMIISHIERMVVHFKGFFPDKGDSP